MLDLSSRKVYGALAEQCVGGDAKADKVETAVAGHLAGLDSNGNLTDSGVSPTEDVTVEGNPVTFDSPFEQDAKSVVVSVKPIQDLHGYDKPWPAGGGKNKFIGGNGGSQGGVTITKNSDGSYSFNGTSTEQVVFTIAGEYYLPNGSYILSGGTSDIHIGFSYGSERADDTGAGVSFSISDGKISWVQFVIPTGVNTTGKTIYPMVRLATESDATFAPYSNICPISGTVELEISVADKDYLDMSDMEHYGIVAVNGQAEINANEYAYPAYNVPNGQQVVVSRKSVSSAGYFWYGCYSANQLADHISPLSFGNLGNNALNATIDIPNGTNILVIFTGADVPVDLRVTQVAPIDTTIPLPSTLYDADVDVTDGDADNKYGIVDLGSLSWIRAGSYFWCYVDGKKNGRINMISDCYKVVNKQYGELEFGEICGDNESSAITTFDPRYSNVSDFANAVTGLKLCYELATSTTISFDPTDVELLEGTNVVSTNAEKVAVTYGRSLWQDIDDLKTDTEGKLNKSDVADVEGDTASKAYSVNDFMLRSDGFYKVTQPIAQNASITSSNTTKTTIGAVLTALLNA